MTITAKYAGRCAVCGGAIRPGSKIEWSRGSATCVACAAHGGGASKPTAATRAAARKAPLASGKFQSRRLREPGESERLIQRSGRSGYGIGETLHCTRVPSGGGPDGHYWTVVDCGQQRVSQYEDDTREGEWVSDAIARPATDDEARPVAERIASAAAEAAAKAAALAILTTGAGMGRTEPANECRTIAIEPGRPGSYASTAYIVADESGTCHHVRPVYDDSPVYTRLAASLAEVQAAIATAGWRVIREEGR